MPSRKLLLLSLVPLITGGIVTLLLIGIPLYSFPDIAYIAIDASLSKAFPLLIIFLIPVIITTTAHLIRKRDVYDIGRSIFYMSAGVAYLIIVYLVWQIS